MNPKRLIVVFLLLISLFLFALMIPAQASPSAQVQFPSPTPGADGRILYIVQAGDSCFRIQALYGITVDTLRGLNPQLDENCTLVVGDELMLGIGGPAALSPTPGPSPTLEPPTVTPTPPAGTTEICVLLYDDVNGDALRQETETGPSALAIQPVLSQKRKPPFLKSTRIPWNRCRPASRMFQQGNTTSVWLCQRITTQPWN